MKWNLLFLKKMKLSNQNFKQHNRPNYWKKLKLAFYTN